MNGDDRYRSCPSWCQEPAGHLRPEPNGPGGYHTAEIALIDLPERDGIRGDPLELVVRIEQYVTHTTADPPVITLGSSDIDEPDREGLTADETEDLVGALQRAIATLRAGSSGAGFVV
ncbi:hypothetical protein [Frankia sp. R43]|uniref:DUF6907 domain-containing protein n=1 Tax=Frankia sp. R43 TaxID=269536 RepID=UPI0035100BB4